MLENQDKAWLLKEKYNGEKTAEFLADCARLAAGEPLAYLIGHVPFLGCTIYLDSKPLIPRPETEFWVEKAILTIRSYQNPHSHPRGTLGISLGFPSGKKVLDLCAGSGCIGIAVAKHVPEAEVTFAEIEPTHLPTIHKNCIENCHVNLSVDLKVLQSELFENITGTFDFILSNPPYIDPALDRTDSSVKNHEPHLALYGGKNGIELIERIIKEAPGYLHQGGQLWLEHEPEQAELITTLGATSGFTISTLPDQYDTLRYSVLVLQ